MKRFVCIILCALAVCSCARRSRVIPEDTLAKIYIDMLMQDQWIGSNSQYRKTADTTLVYDHIFADYGFTVEDYNRSVDYYIHHPKRFEKILTNAGKRMENYAKRLEKVDKAWKDAPKPPVWKKVDFDTAGAKVKLDTTALKLYEFITPYINSTEYNKSNKTQDNGKNRTSEKMLLLHGSDNSQE